MIALTMLRQLPVKDTKKSTQRTKRLGERLDQIEGASQDLDRQLSGSLGVVRSMEQRLSALETRLNGLPCSPKKAAGSEGHAK